MQNELADKDCEDCKGTGEIEVETIVLGRPSMVKGELTYPVTAYGDWHKAICHCID